MNRELKLVLKELFNHKPKLVVVAVAGILMAIGQGQISIISSKLVDAAKDHPEKLPAIAIFGIATVFLMNLSRYIHIYVMNVVSEHVSQELRQKLQKKFMNLDLKFLNKYASGSGGLMSRTFNDVRVIHDGLRLFADLFSAPLTFIILIYTMREHNARLALYTLLLAPVIIIVLSVLSKSIRKYSLLGMQQLEDITSTVKESLDGVRTIQAYTLQNLMSQKLKNQGLDFIRMRSRMHSRIESIGPFNEFVAGLLVVAITFYFASQISQGKSTYGELVGFITVLLQLNIPLKKFQEAFVRIQETQVSAIRVFGILEEKSTLIESPSPTEWPRKWSTIQFKDVTFAFSDKKPLIADFNLTIKQGQTVALVGESGSGKSTIANLLLRFYDPLKGQILIDQVDIRDLKLDQLREKMGLVSQDVFLFSDTIAKNVQGSVADYDLNKIQNSVKASNAFDFIHRMPDALQTNVGERGGLLSGGEKQRVAIARAIYKDAPILILDEATSALDSVSEEKVQTGLLELMKGRTALVIAHRLSTIQYADLILVMKNGFILEQGTHQELIQKNGEYKKLFDAQSI